MTFLPLSTDLLVKWHAFNESRDPVPSPDTGCPILLRGNDSCRVQLFKESVTQPAGPRYARRNSRLRKGRLDYPVGCCSYSLTASCYSQSAFGQHFQNLPTILAKCWEYSFNRRHGLIPSAKRLYRARTSNRTTRVIRTTLREGHDFSNLLKDEAFHSLRFDRALVEPR